MPFLFLRFFRLQTQQQIQITTQITNASKAIIVKITAIIVVSSDSAIWESTRSSTEATFLVTNPGKLLAVSKFVVDGVPPCDRRIERFREGVKRVLVLTVGVVAVLIVSVV